MRCVVCKREVPEHTKVCPYCGGRFFTVGEPPPFTLPPRASRKENMERSSFSLFRLSVELLLWVLLWGICLWVLSVPVDLRILVVVILSLFVYGSLRWADLQERTPTKRKSDGSQPQPTRTHRLP